MTLRICISRYIHTGYKISEVRTDLTICYINDVFRSIIHCHRQRFHCAEWCKTDDTPICFLLLYADQTVVGKFYTCCFCRAAVDSQNSKKFGKENRIFSGNTIGIPIIRKVHSVHKTVHRESIRIEFYRLDFFGSVHGRSSCGARGNNFCPGLGKMNHIDIIGIRHFDGSVISDLHTDRCLRFYFFSFYGSVFRFYVCNDLDIEEAGSGNSPLICIVAKNTVCLVKQLVIFGSAFRNLTYSKRCVGGDLGGFGNVHLYSIVRPVESKLTFIVFRNLFFCSDGNNSFVIFDSGDGINAVHRSEFFRFVDNNLCHNISFFCCGREGKGPVLCKSQTFFDLFFIDKYADMLVGDKGYFIRNSLIGIFGSFFLIVLLFAFFVCSFVGFVFLILLCILFIGRIFFLFVFFGGFLPLLFLCHCRLSVFGIIRSFGNDSSIIFGIGCILCVIGIVCFLIIGRFRICSSIIRSVFVFILRIGFRSIRRLLILGFAFVGADSFRVLCAAFVAASRLIILVFNFGRVVCLSGRGRRIGSCSLRYLSCVHIVFRTLHLCGICRFCFGIIDFFCLCSRSIRRFFCNGYNP